MTSESRDEKMETKGFFPTFDVIEEGFSCINMVDREDEPYAPRHRRKHLNLAGFLA